MSLWLCLRFPLLPLECLSRASEHPVVVLEKQRVVNANEPALAAGVRSGQSGNTVRALVTDESLQLLERDHDAEQRTLRRLEQWAYSVTPTLECWGQDSLQLEVGSCLQLYGSLATLIDRLQQALLRRGFTLQLGVAPNRPAAWLLSYREDDLARDSSQPLSDRLAALPIALIPSDTRAGFPKAVASLQKAGIETFSALLALPTSAIAKRCGKAFGDWLHRVSSNHDEARRDFKPPPSFYDALWFGFEIRNTVELEPAMAQLLEAFCQFLGITQLTTARIDWLLLRMRGEPQTLTVRTSEALSNPARWLELSRLHLERLTIGDDIEGLALNVTELSEGHAIADDLFSQSHNTEPLHNLVDRLRSRLGLQAVSQISLRDAHLPEHSQYLSQNSPELTPPLINQGQRPFWLMTEPQPVHAEGEQLQWNGMLELIHGPERIEDNWWQQPISRDYYIARRADGQSIWLFQDRHNRRWYVHGIFA